MTSPVRLLFVDDIEGNYRSVQGSLEQIFAERDCQVTIEYLDKPHEACAVIDSRRPYDVVVTDLLFPPYGQATAPRDKQQIHGYEVIRRARRVGLRTVIVVLTDGDPDNPDLERIARELDTDLYLDRRDLLPGSRYGGVANLVAEIYERLSNRELIQIGPRTIAADEAGIGSVLFEVTETNMRLLLSDLLAPARDRSDEVTLSYVTPGASGAHVVRARPKSGRHLLVKVSRDRAALERERANYDDLLGMYRADLIVPYGSAVHDRNGWYAIMMVFAEDALTLRSWLSEPASAPYVDEVFDQLFLRRGLASRYRGEPTDRVRPITRLQPEVFRRVRVRAAAARLEAVLGHPDCAGVADHDTILDVVARFTGDARVGAVAPDETPYGLLVVPAHGDLHGGNVLVRVEGHPQPLIIDLSSFDDHHWAFDPARLMADIVLRSLDNTVESHLWRRFGDWRVLAGAAGDLQDNAVTDALAENAAVVAALRWMARHREDILPPLADRDRWWEWHVCLAEQYLRGTYQHDVPPAKQALALVAAYDQLGRAESRMPRPPRNF